MGISLMKFFLFSDKGLEGTIGGLYMKRFFKFKSLFFYGVILSFIVVSAIYLFQMSSYLVKVSQYQLPTPKESVMFKRY